MKRAFKQFLDAVEVYIPAAVFALLIASIFIQVVLRYVFNSPSPELFEISIYAFVWVIYLGGALASRYDQHIRFDLIYRGLKRPAQIVVDLVFNLATLGILLYLLVPSFRYTFEMYKIKASALRIPWTFLLIVYPVFILLVIIHTSTTTYRGVRELMGKGRAPEETPPWI
ncbi:MAG TPA: TRAP transporter small permease [Spirochaetia bacterium]|nr:TRAP transporter small permease [Spirochaetales bacterium]HRY79587.1 TRAP transporter small permease [Spirochaetia bacterium]HRZ87851.1 TRAP transporter small permease [Spirochaetia bacterium]